MPAFRLSLAAFVLAALIMLAAMGWATQFIAGLFDYHKALGPPLLHIGETAFYPPWSVLGWIEAWDERYPRPFAAARLIVFGGLVLSLAVLGLLARHARAAKPFGAGAWAKRKDIKKSGLLAASGAVLGKVGCEILCFDGAEHQLLIGASRAGKGRGHVIPTLLAWPDSALVLDVKGELADGDPRHDFPGCAGWREALGPVLRFAPTRKDSAAFNPLFEVRLGESEVRDVQNIVEIIVDPAGDRAAQDFWDRSAKSVLVGVVLHVLYAEPLHRKNLAVVREKLRDLERTAEEMRLTLHRRNLDTGMPEVHPEVLHAAESYLSGDERMQAAIKATAESFFGLFADPLVAEKTATSDLRIGDLMCAERPVTLFLQPPPSDAARLMPLMRLVLNQVARSLMEHQNADAGGRPKRRRLILLLDEFPQLGRMPFFETAMGAMAGYGLKAYLVCQSLNHIIRAYGRDNVILDNCHIVTAFAAADMETAKTIAAMAGEVWELRPQETRRRPQSLFSEQGSTTFREERRPLLLPGDVRALGREEQLIFVAGAKPIRARKLRFDREPVFQRRLFASQRKPAKLSTWHDWLRIASLGVLFAEPGGVVRIAPPGHPIGASPASPPPSIKEASGRLNGASPSAKPSAGGSNGPMGI